MITPLAGKDTCTEYRAAYYCPTGCDVCLHDTESIEEEERSLLSEFMVKRYVKKGYRTEWHEDGSILITRPGLPARSYDPEQVNVLRRCTERFVTFPKQ